MEAKRELDLNEMRHVNAGLSYAGLGIGTEPLTGGTPRLSYILREKIPQDHAAGKARR